MISDSCGPKCQTPQQMVGEFISEDLMLQQNPSTDAM